MFVMVTLTHTVHAYIAVIMMLYTVSCKTFHLNSNTITLFNSHRFTIDVAVCNRTQSNKLIFTLWGNLHRAMCDLKIKQDLLTVTKHIQSFTTIAPLTTASIICNYQDDEFFIIEKDELFDIHAYKRLPESKYRTYQYYEQTIQAIPLNSLKERCIYFINAHHKQMIPYRLQTWLPQELQESLTRITLLEALEDYFARHNPAKSCSTNPSNCISHNND
jgi:hypothetical protein